MDRCYVSQVTAPLRRGLLVGLLAGAATLAWQEVRLEADCDRHSGRMEAIAAEAAAALDGAAHATLAKPEDAQTPAFERARAHLRTVRDRHKLRSDVYTLRRDGDATRFVVMTSLTPFLGDPYEGRSEMRAVFERGERARTGLYFSDTGPWVSGFAPVMDGDRVEALVEVDRPSRDLVLQRHRGWLYAGLAAFLFGLLAAWLPSVLGSRNGFVGAIRHLFAGSLMMRIGLAGTGSVVLAVGVVAALDLREARRELLSRLETQLVTAVRVGAPRIDPAAHARIAASGSGDSEDFRRQRQVLREIQQAAGLTTPVYTFRRDGGRARFVVMTNETPFVGDTNELRPSTRARRAPRAPTPTPPAPGSRRSRPSAARGARWSPRCRRTTRWGRC